MNYPLLFSVGIFFFELICSSSHILRILPFVIVVLFLFCISPLNLLYGSQIISPLLCNMCHLYVYKNAAAGLECVCRQRETDEQLS